MALIIRYNEVSDALAPYTAVDSDEVLQRIQASLMPWHTQAPATIARIHRRPDLKGPACCLLTVLILSTLVHRGEGWREYTITGWLMLQVTTCAGSAMLAAYVVVMSAAVWVARSTLPDAPPVGNLLADVIEAAAAASDGFFPVAEIRIA